MPDVLRAGARSARRVLYVQRSAGGGSVISLLLLVKNLDRSRFTPVVLFHDPSPYADAFADLGAEVLVLDGSPEIRPLSRFVPGNLGALGRRRRAHRVAKQMSKLLRWDLPRARQIADLVRGLGADLVHSNVSPAADRASILGAALASVPQVSHVRFLRGHSPLLDMPLSYFVDHYLCVSDYVQRQIHAEAGVPERKTSRLYNPFEFPTPPVATRRGELRSALGIADDELLLTNVGRLVRWKGQDIFLRAFADVVRDHPSARAFIVGGASAGPSGQDFVAELHRLVSALDLSGRVTFTGHRSDVKELMSASDVVVHSSSEPEPLGRVVMEAIALGRPVVATEAGGVPELVKKGGMGRLVPPGDVKAMAAAISGLLGDPQAAETMAERARQVAEKQFRFEEHVQAVQRLYDRVLGTRV